MSLQRYMQRFLAGMTLILALSSCIYDHYSDEDITGQKPDDMLLVLHITPIATRGETTDVVEKINSLRIIILNTTEGEEGDKVTTIEYNKKIRFNNDNEADGFNYDLTWRTKPGTKQFYFFANEESVGEISYQKSEQETDLPTSLTKLTDLLDSYQPIEDSDSEEAIAEKQQKATKFNEVINSVYFSPKYEIENNEIYLPYTAYYGGIKVTEAEDKSSGFYKIENMPKNMYLVPVATKFYFSFYNYHNNPVEIKNLSIKSIASQNFLLGHVDESEQKKNFDGVEMYWVDWLAKVAEKTNDSNLDNEDINKEYGWISAYQLPENTEHKEAVLIGDKTVKIIPVSTDEKKDPLYLGPYYFPESCNKTNQDDNTTQEQDYELYLYLHDMKTESTSGDFESKDGELKIGNVKALFRDTSVLITVTMKNGNVEAYAQIEEWEHGDFSGWAEGGTEL